MATCLFMHYFSLNNQYPVYVSHGTGKDDWNVLIARHHQWYTTFFNAFLYIKIGYIENAT